MALRLRIVSEHASRLGELSTKIFSVHGGTIGRARDNEWILPDPERYLSGKHARVEFRAGTYYLVDTSSNGTFVNGAQTPLGKLEEYAMKDGDYIRLGEYELLASIDNTNDFPPDEGAIVAYDGAAPPAAVKKSTADDIGADLDLSELLEPSNQLDRDVASSARDAYGQAIGPVDDVPELPEEPSSAVPWHMMTRPLSIDRAAPAPDRARLAAERAAAPRAQSGVLFDGEFDAGLSAFCRGAGIDPRSLTSDARASALHRAGQLLRESVLGLMELNQGRGEYHNRLRIPPVPTADSEYAVGFTQGVEETLLNLLNTVSTRAGSVEAMREQYRGLKGQNAATLTAMRAALDEVIGRFDPTELAERFERGTKRGVFGAPNKGKYWDLYAELYAGLSQRPPDGFPHLFIEAFAKAYEAKLRMLVPPRRGSFDRDAADPDTQAIGDH